jgi:aryl-alcohol dehydrogenase-like predicted oxidoreductase
LASVQGLLNLREREAFERQLEFCVRERLPFIAFQPLACGALANRGDRLDSIAETRGATRAQIALAWLLHRSPVVVPIPGTASLQHLRENARAALLRLTDEEVSELDLA